MLMSTALRDKPPGVTHPGLTVNQSGDRPCTYGVFMQTLLNQVNNSAISYKSCRLRPTPAAQVSDSFEESDIYGGAMHTSP